MGNFSSIFSEAPKFHSEDLNENIKITNPKNNHRLEKHHKNVNKGKHEVDKNIPGPQGTFLDDYKIIKKIGSGSFGKVYLIKSKINDQLYALKIIDKTKIINEKQFEMLKTEKSIQEKIDHPFINKVHSTSETVNKLLFIMDYYNGGDIFSHLVKVKRFNEKTAKIFCAQIYLALDYLHNKNIIYRDLKSENLILDENGNIKLIDFGLAKDNVNSQNKTRTKCGTGEYLGKKIVLIYFSAPEIILGDPYECNVDWWEYGIIIYEMLVGVTPFQDQDKIETYKKILKKQPDFLYRKEKINISIEAEDLILNLLAKNPNDRISPDKIPFHSWFKDINFNDVFQQKVKSPYLPKVILKEDNFIREDLFSKNDLKAVQFNKEE